MDRMAGSDVYSGRGFLGEEWGTTDSNREAKFYRLTPAGRAQLRREIARWNNYAAFMTAALATRKS
jgi:DNA-binding PadR family transcriptional regulator